MVSTPHQRLPAPFHASSGPSWTATLRKATPATKVDAMTDYFTPPTAAKQKSLTETKCHQMRGRKPFHGCAVPLPHASLRPEEGGFISTVRSGQYTESMPPKPCHISAPRSKAARYQANGDPSCSSSVGLHARQLCTHHERKCRNPYTLACLIHAFANEDCCLQGLVPYCLSGTNANASWIRRMSRGTWRISGSKLRGAHKAVEIAIALESTSVVL